MKRTAGAAILLAAIVLFLVAGTGITAAQSTENVTFSGEVENPDGSPATGGHVLIYQRTSSYELQTVTRIELRDSASFSVDVTPGYEYGVLYFQSVPSNDNLRYPKDGIPDLYTFGEANVQSGTDVGTLSLPAATRITPRVFQAATTTPITDAEFNISSGSAELSQIDANANGQLEIDGSNGVGIEVADSISVSVDSTSPKYYSYYLSSESYYSLDDANPTLYLQRNNPPEAVISGPDTVHAGETITMDASNSTDPDNQIEAVAWDWQSDGEIDDNSSGYLLENTTDFYSSVPGTYQTTLVVEDEPGLTDTATKTIAVSEPNLNYFIIRD